MYTSFCRWEASLWKSSVFLSPALSQTALERCLHINSSCSNRWLISLDNCLSFCWVSVESALCRTEANSCFFCYKERWICPNECLFQSRRLRLVRHDLIFWLTRADPLTRLFQAVVTTSSHSLWLSHIDSNRNNFFWGLDTLCWPWLFSSIGSWSEVEATRCLTTARENNSHQEAVARSTRSRTSPPAFLRFDRMSHIPKIM